MCTLSDEQMEAFEEAVKVGCLYRPQGKSIEIFRCSL